MSLKKYLVAKRATNAKQLEQCQTDSERKSVVCLSGQPHGAMYKDEWMPSIGQFHILGDGIMVTQWAFTSQEDAAEKAREMFKEWKKERRTSFKN